MPESSFKKRKGGAKSHRVYRGAAAGREVNSPKPVEKTNKNHPAVVSHKPVDEKIGLTGEPAQRQPGTEPVKPVPEPRIKASDLFTFRKRTLSAEARELLTKIDEGGIPLVITENLERIAKAHGIEVSYEMTPNDIIARLRKLA